MKTFSSEELTLILALYYFKKNSLSSNVVLSFTNRLNSRFKKDYSAQSVSYELSLFRQVDPDFHTTTSKADAECQKIWNLYIGADKIRELKNIFHNFNNNFFYATLDETKLDEKEDENLLDTINDSYEHYSPTQFRDEPKKLYTEKTEVSVSHRNPQVIVNAIAAAGFRCEVDGRHPTFLRKDGKSCYVEGHHLIPLKFQPYFSVNLDVEANVVSLCVTCHKRLHYGTNNDEILKKLFESRKDRLEKCGIVIKLDDLLQMYK